MNNNNPDHITFQWHITEQCNLRCKHCYQDSYTEKGVSISQLSDILSQLESFVLSISPKENKVKAHINITGGEPFLRVDILDLIEKIKSKGLFSFAILSNGLLMEPVKLERLKKLAPRFIQVSMEGKKKTNDSIRGQGSYKYIVNALKTYHKYNIPTLLSFTANALNYKEFPTVVKTGIRYKAAKVWTDRYLPNSKEDKLLMAKDQFKEFSSILRKEKSRKHLFSKTIVGTDRALQFLTCGGMPYRCSAGDSLLTIMANGDLVPCRRLPVVIGNLLKDNLVDLYQNAHVLNNLRDSNKLNKDCKQCYYSISCCGGLKCLSYAITGDFHHKDIHCSL